MTDTVLPGALPIRECYWQIQCNQSESVIGRYILTSQRMLLVDTVSPVVLPIREWFWQIQCYQSESVIGRYSVTRIVTSQKEL